MVGRSFPRPPARGRRTRAVAQTTHEPDPAGQTRRTRRALSCTNPERRPVRERGRLPPDALPGRGPAGSQRRTERQPHRGRRRGVDTSAGRPARRQSRRGPGAGGRAPTWPEGFKMFCRRLNYRRPSFDEQVRRGLLMWMSTAQLKELSWHAGDFWCWRSAILDFNGSEAGEGPPL